MIKEIKQKHIVEDFETPWKVGTTFKDKKGRIHIVSHTNSGYCITLLESKPSTFAFTSTLEELKDSFIGYNGGFEIIDINIEEII